MKIQSRNTGSGEIIFDSGLCNLAIASAWEHRRPSIFMILHPLAANNVMNNAVKASGNQYFR